MDLETFELHNLKISMIIEMRIFEELKQIHIDEKHKHNFIYLCAKCNSYCEQILNDLITHKQIVNKNFIEQIKQIEEERKIENQNNTNEKMLEEMKKIGIVDNNGDII
jgi:hypothetical protein